MKLKRFFGQFRYLPRRHMRFLGVAFGFIVLAQLLIPSDYVLPRTYVDGMSVGMQSKQTLRQTLTKRGQSLSMVFADKKKDFKSSQAGLNLDVTETLDQLPVFSFKTRVTPFAPLIAMIRGSYTSAVVQKDSQKIQVFARERARTEFKAPVDAKAEIKNGRLALIKETPGQRFSRQAITQALDRESLLSDRPVEVTGEVIRPAVHEKELKPLQKQFQRATAQPLKVTYGDITKEVKPKTVGTWLEVKYYKTGWKLVINPSKFKKPMSAWAKAYNQPSGITQVIVVDGVEVSRIEGEPGRALDEAAIVQQLNQWLQKPEPKPVALAALEIPPRLAITRTHSWESAALQAKLNAWLAGRPGRFQIAIQELGGRGRAASHNVSEQTFMASTYKTFLAFAAYRQAEAGILNLSAPLVGGKNIEQCIEVMIVVSDNECGIALGRHIGWGKVDQIIAASGFQNVTLNRSNGMLVNAKEQAKFLAQLSAGSLMNSTNTDKLLGYMKRQVYRNGIAAGSRGAAVANKVGFLDKYIHDVGIVYGAKSTYALVIMTKGSDWSAIRDLSQAVYDFMNE